MSISAFFVGGGYTGGVETCVSRWVWGFIADLADLQRVRGVCWVAGIAGSWWFVLVNSFLVVE